MSTITKNTIFQQLLQLGISTGDILFVSADLLHVGYFNNNAKQTTRDWIDIFRQLVSDTGTIVVPTYNETYKVRKLLSNPDYYQRDHITSGSFSKAILSQSDAYRSTHPTHSYAAIGPHSREILANHSETSSCYYPFHYLTKLGAKTLMLGTLNKSNSPMTYHLAQELTGLTYSHPSSNKYGRYFLGKSGSYNLFVRRDVGGCTRGVYQSYSHLLLRNAMYVSSVGQTSAALINSQLSLDIFLELLSRNPSIFKCDDIFCGSCYGRFHYNSYGVLPFYFRYIYNRLSSLVSSPFVNSKYR